MAEREIDAGAAPAGAGKGIPARYPVPSIRGATSRAFLPVLGLTLLAWFISWPFLTLAFLNHSDVPDVAWIHRLYQRKEVALRRAAANGRPRLVIIGGSGALFGVDAELISRRLHVDAINDATHAGLGTYVLRQAESVLRPGDSALLCPEYETWSRDDLTDIEWEYAVTYDKRFVWRSGAMEGLRSLYRVPADEYWTSLCAWGSWLIGRDSVGGYGVATLDAAGDLRRAARDQPFAIPARGDLPDPTSSSMGTQAFRDFGQWARSNRVRVFYSWANMCRPESPAPAVTPPRTQALLDQCGFVTLNAPAETCFPPEWFFDTIYHLDGGGRRVRTEALLARLAPYYGQTAAAPAQQPEGIYLVGHDTIWLHDGNAFDGRPGVCARYLVLMPDGAPGAITPRQLAELARRGVPVYCDDPAVTALLPRSQWETRDVDRDAASIAGWLRRYDHHVVVLARSGERIAPGAPLGPDLPADVRQAIEGGRPAVAVLGTGRWRGVHAVRTGLKYAQIKSQSASLVGRGDPSLAIVAEARESYSRIRADVRIMAEADDGQICAAVIDPEQGIVVATATFPGGGTKAVWSMKQLIPRPEPNSAPVR